jgi:hypothetical protein
VRPSPWPAAALRTPARRSCGRWPALRAGSPSPQRSSARTIDHGPCPTGHRPWVNVEAVRALVGPARRSSAGRPGPPPTRHLRRHRLDRDHPVSGHRPAGLRRSAGPDALELCRAQCPHLRRGRRRGHLVLEPCCGPTSTTRRGRSSAPMPSSPPTP